MTLGHEECLPGEGYNRLGLGRGRLTGASKALKHADERFFKLAAQDCVGAQPAKQAFVDWSVQAVKAQMRSRVELADGGQHFDREARRGVHRHVESNQVRLTHRLLAQRLAREVQTRYPGAGAPQPRRRRRQPKRLPAELVSGNQNNVWRITHEKRQCTFPFFLCWLQTAIDLSPVTDIMNRDLSDLRVDFVHNAVVADSDPIKSLRT